MKGCFACMQLQRPRSVAFFVTPGRMMVPCPMPTWLPMPPGELRRSRPRLSSPRKYALDYSAPWKLYGLTCTCTWHTHPPYQCSLWDVLQLRSIGLPTMLRCFHGQVLLHACEQSRVAVYSKWRGYVHWLAIGIFAPVTGHVLGIKL